MELAADEMGMIGQFNHFNVGSIGRRSGNAQSGRCQRFFVFTVEFVAMPVTLADFCLAVDFISQGIGLDLAGPGSKAHGAPEFFYATQFTQLINYAMVCGRIELAGIGLSQSANVASK